MNIEVLFFGATADAVGLGEVRLTVEERSSAQSLIDRLAQDHPALEKHKLLIAINEEYVDPDACLNDGDQLALFTAVSGG